MTDEQKLERPIVDSAPAKKVSAGDVLAGLRDDIALMAGRLDEVADFTRRAKNALLAGAEEQRAAGVRMGLESVFCVHDVVFRHLGSEVPGGNGDGGGGFLRSLLETIEGELGRHQIQVIEPLAGDPHDSTLMSILATQPVDSKDADGTVARVHRCGFLLEIEGQQQVLRKVEVDIHRKTT